MTAYLIALVLACAADVFTTARNLKTGGKELNYLPAWLIDKLGPWPVMLSTKVVMVGIALAINVRELYVCLAILNLAAAVFNWTRRAK